MAQMRVNGVKRGQARVNKGKRWKESRREQMKANEAKWVRTGSKRGQIGDKRDKRG